MSYVAKYTKLNLLGRGKYITLSVALVALSGFGLLFVTVSHAGVPATSIQPENGTVSSAASILDSSASGGKAVKFGAMQTTNCVASPHLCGFPDATNTGVPVGTVLTDVPSQMTSGPGWTWRSDTSQVVVNTDGTVISGLNITGSIHVLANNVTIKNTRLTTGTYYPIRFIDGNYTGLLVEDTEIIGTSTDATGGIAGSNYTARRVNVHGTADGLDPGNNVTIEDSFIHDLAYGESTHNDGSQDTGSSNITLRHNTIFNKNHETSCIMIGNENGVPDNITIDNNLLDGGNYTIYLDPSATQVNVTNNHFGRDYVYYLMDSGGSSDFYTQSGNVWDDTGAPLSL